MRHSLVNKNVIIIRGQFKGQLGRCTHVNGDQAEIEMSVRAKKVHLPLKDIKESASDMGMMFSEGNPNNRQGGNNGMDMRQNPEKDEFNATAMGGGMTNYGGGMT